MKFHYPKGATPLDPDSARGLIPNLQVQAELNAFEQTNIQTAFVWALKSKDLKTNLISVSGIKLLHKKMFDQTWEWAGSFRKHDTNIGAPWQHISELLKAMCDDVQYWIDNKLYDHDEIAVRFHHRLVLIHPFPNGNGRLSRLVADLLLEFNSLPMLNWGSKETLVDDGADRKEYLIALREADGGRLKRLIDFAKGSGV